MPIENDQLVKVLLEKKLIDQKTLDKWLSSAKNQGISLVDLLFSKQVLSEENLGAAVAEIYGVPFVQLGDMTIKETLSSIVPYAMASHQYVIPFAKEGNTLKVAMNNPHAFELINFLENKTGLNIEVYYATKNDIQLALKAYNPDINKKFAELLHGALEDPNNIESLKDASKIVDAIILFAHQNEASDIHLEPRKDVIVVRYRIDGILNVVAELPSAIAELIVTRIKVLSNLRTDEHRAAQDGRFKVELEGNDITLRVSILPTYDGEKVVMRLLSSAHQELNLEALGYTDENMKKIQNNILKSHGLILMTGPTGSGKTTTLYSIMKLLNSSDVNISTIEDPIEYRLYGINQTQVNEKTNLTFATGLRSLVRQDPDIIMVGEVRDEETANVAINASLTGHLVLATLHTNDAVSTLPRMLEMGVEGYLLAATAKMVVAQRLVRKICDKCKTSYQLSNEELHKFWDKYKLTDNLDDILNTVSTDGNSTYTFYKGDGCEACNGTGYKGRTCISEVLEVDEDVQKSIINGDTSDKLLDVAKKKGMKTMFYDGITKVLSGDTTVEEVLRVMRT